MFDFGSSHKFQFCYDESVGLSSADIKIDYASLGSNDFGIVGILFLLFFFVVEEGHRNGQEVSGGGVDVLKFNN